MRQLLLLSLLLCIACTEILSVPDISLDEVSLYSPGHETELSVPEIHYSWSKLEEVDGYRLQLFLEVSPSSNLLLDTLIPRNQYSDSLSMEGKYRWRVRGENFGYATPYVQSTFVYRTPQFSDDTLQLNAPAQSANLKSSSLLFSWDAFKNALQYRFQLVQTDFGQAQVFLYDSILTQPHLNLKLQDTGTYSWRVRAEQNDALSAYSTRTFKIQDPFSGEALELLSPENNSRLNDTVVTLNWAPLENSQYYTVQLASPNFDQSRNYVLDSTITERQVRLLVDDNTAFSWRVKGVGDFSETPFVTRRFRTATQDSITQENVRLLAPANNSILTSTAVNLTWYPVEEADGYHVQIATPSFTTPLQIVYDEFVLDFNTAASLQATTSYEWRVKAYNDISETPYTTYKFKIK